MDITYLVTHAIMVICFFSIICSSLDLSVGRAKPKKDRAVVPLLKKYPTKVKADSKVKILKDTPAAFRPDINQKLLSKSMGFKYDMKRIN
jgi:hypothetical protein